MTLSDLEKYRANCELLECIDRQLGKKKVLISTQGSAGPPAYQLVTKKDGYPRICTGAFKVNHGDVVHFPEAITEGSE